MKKIAILGAGISGLSTAYYLKKEFPNSEIKIFESEKVAGGKISTANKNGFLFEQGPRGVRPSGKGRHFLQFVREIGLWDSLVPSNKEAKIRYLFLDGKLEKLPTNPLEGITSKTTEGVFSAIYKDLFTPKKENENESIREFIERRFGKKIANNLIDPVISGIYAGDISKLSASETIFFLTEPEKYFGGVVKGLVKAPKSKPEIEENFGKIEKAALVTFKGGMQTLVEKLAEILKENLLLEAKIHSLKKVANKIVLTYANGKFEADLVISTIPAFILKEILAGFDEKLSSLLGKIFYAPITVSSLGFEKKVNPLVGFGYLVPHKENQPILGGLWNDQIFNGISPKDKSSFTVMLGGACSKNFDSFSENEFTETALKTTQIHLGFSEKPSVKFSKVWSKGIPQFNVGHKKIVEEIQSVLKGENLVISGNFVGGVSVIDCVKDAKFLAERIKRENFKK